jgi:predicted MPP superfamily phosphohydrolase
MKNHQMLIFLTIVLLLYLFTNIYIFFKGYHTLPDTRNIRSLYIIIFIILSCMFIAGKILESRHSSVISDILNIIGGFWLAFMLYAFMFLVISDIFLLILRLPGLIHGHDIILFRKWSVIITLIFSVALITGGFINAVIPVVRNYDITINKSAGEVKYLRIAAVSDIHLGSVIRKRSMKQLSGILEKIQPDVVFLLGDIVDGEIGPVLRGDLLKYFKCPECRIGLYAITGNHEYIGGAERTIPYIESKGIRLLKDEVTILQGGIQLIGRLDRDSRRFNGHERLPLSELMKEVDPAKPVILLDHQPFNLDESEKHGIDLQLSGHTHNGQMWPLNHLTRLIYELSYGYKKKGNSQFIVSSGFGLWGPRIRSGSRSEVLLINVKFSGKAMQQD